jgi:hypothetical protein
MEYILNFLASPVKKKIGFLSYMKSDSIFSQGDVGEERMP